MQLAKNGRVPHAQLFLGNEGTGALSLAIAYAQYLNCEHPTDNDSCGKCKSCIKYNALSHPDLHFVYPVVKTPKNSKPVSADFAEQWRKFISASKFHSYNQWLSTLGTENSQASIYAQEAEEIIKALTYKPYEAEFKVMIIWLPEKMNITAANKLLKMIEEPPHKTVFILVAQNDEEILPTIKSRTQLVKIPRLSQEELAKAIKQEYPQVDEEKIKEIARISNGNFFEAQNFLEEILNPDQTKPNLDLFIEFMRLAYAAKVIEMIDFVDTLSALGREKIKHFLSYSIHLLRQSFVLNLGQEKISYLTDKEFNFINNFAKYINKKNITPLTTQFNSAIADIERNGYAKIVLLDLMFKTAKLLKIK